VALAAEDFYLEVGSVALGRREVVAVMNMLQLVAKPADGAGAGGVGRGRLQRLVR
jgi:hypothetical protein